MDTRHVETNRDIVRTHLTHSIDGRGTWCQDGLTQGFSMLAVQKKFSSFPQEQGTGILEDSEDMHYRSESSGLTMCTDVPRSQRPNDFKAIPIQ